MCTVCQSSPSDPSLRTAREQLALARTDLFVGAHRALDELDILTFAELRLQCALMCEAILQHAAAVEAYESALAEPPVHDRT